MSVNTKPEAVSVPKREIEKLIDQLKKAKKKPSDWTFVPRRKHHESARILLKDGEMVMVADGKGAFKSKATVKAITVKVSSVRSVGKDGTLNGGFVPKAIGEFTAEDVLASLITASLDPACEVVPYEAREMGKDVKVAESLLLQERASRLEAEAKLKAFEDQGFTPARFAEMEAQIAELTKPPKGGK